MRRIPVVLPVVAVVLLGAFALGLPSPSTVAQDGTPGAVAGHPIVGAWQLTDLDSPDEPPALVLFHADGTYAQVGAEGGVAIGSWEATGERSVAVTIVEQFGDEAGVFTLTVRAAGEVDASGDAFTGTYTIEVILPDGTSPGEYGPGTLEGERIAVEPMGTPVGTLEELDALFEEGTPDAATPVATPANHGGTDGGADASAPLDLWPAPDDPLERARLAGLEPERREHLDYHVHAHLDIFLDGRPVVVPAGIGINVDDPGVRRFDTPGGTGYGGIDLCDEPCISPLHTHDTTGILHTESPRAEPNTLGQFFVQWGVWLDASCVGEFCRPETPIAVYVDGEPYAGNPADIVLADLKQIAIVIGTPPAEIPATADFSGA